MAEWGQTDGAGRRRRPSGAEPWLRTMVQTQCANPVRRPSLQTQCADPVRRASVQTDAAAAPPPVRRLGRRRQRASGCDRTSEGHGRPSGMVRQGLRPERQRPLRRCQRAANRSRGGPLGRGIATRHRSRAAAAETVWISQQPTPHPCGGMGHPAGEPRSPRARPLTWALLCSAGNRSPGRGKESLMDRVILAVTPFSNSVPVLHDAPSGRLHPARQRPAAVSGDRCRRSR